MAQINYQGAGALPGHTSGEVSPISRIGRFFATLADYRRLYRAERELNALDDRMLADIGVSRTDIHQLVWGDRRVI